MQQQQRRLLQPRGDSSAYSEWAPGRPGLATRGVQAWMMTSDSSTYLLTYEGTAVSDARATGRVLSSQWGVFPMTQEMMQRS